MHKPPAETVSPDERRVDTPGGRVFVRQIPGEDPPIVLMHGFPDDHRIYNKLLPQLSPRRAVAFDFLGYGRSDRPDAARFSPEDHASEPTAVQWELDADDPDGIAIRSILPQFFGDAAQPDALAAIRGWTAGLFGSLDRQDALIDSGALRQLQVPVSTIFGERDRYLNPSLAAELSGLFKNPSLHLVQDATHYPQHDQPEVVADLLKLST